MRQQLWSTKGYVRVTIPLIPFLPYNKLRIPGHLPLPILGPIDFKPSMQSDLQKTRHNRRGKWIFIQPHFSFNSVNDFLPVASEF